MPGAPGTPRSCCEGRSGSSRTRDSALVTLALAGDTMLGRKVAERLASVPPDALWSRELAALTTSCDAFALNLECCISDRGQPWEDPRKPFFFRAPPSAVEGLTAIGVDAVTLANNHALDYGPLALTDTCALLDGAGIAYSGAGAHLEAARTPVILEAGGLRIAVIGVADHPRDFAAAPERPGIAFTDLRRGVPFWLTDLIGDARRDSDIVVVMPHWGPNMVSGPVAHVRWSAPHLLDAGADVVAGHSAHVFHGVEAREGGAVIYDLGDFIDDYATHPTLRNDLGLLWLLEVDEGGVRGLEAVPLALEYCFTRLADGAEADWIAERLRASCAAMGTRVDRRGERLVVEVDPA